MGCVHGVPDGTDQAVSDWVDELFWHSRILFTHPEHRQLDQASHPHVLLERVATREDQSQETEGTRRARFVCKDDRQ